MTPRKKAQTAFASAVLLLLLSGFASYLMIDRLLESERWVVHTHEVREALGDVDAALARAGRARSAYLVFGDDAFLNEFNTAIAEIPGHLQYLRQLTRDNARQQELCTRLELIMQRRVSIFQESIRIKKQTPQNPDGQADLARQTVPISSEITAVTQQMRANEQALLEIRERASHRLFITSVVTLGVALVLALGLFALHFRLLSAELRARELAERVARESEESLRRLSGRLLQLQDAERRKFSRELHDSLGQSLVGAKMNLEMFATQRKENLIAEAVQLLDQSIAETRTISHLLHPPLLDEVGFSSAAIWFVEGFAQRSGIEVKVDLPEDTSRLPKAVALGFFRVLQESLTNIHRHSGSARAEVTLEMTADRALLTVRDYGKGFRPEWIGGLRSSGVQSGMQSGVGLAGMRERAYEFGGEFNIQPCVPGTMISVSVPLAESSNQSNFPAAG